MSAKTAAILEEAADVIRRNGWHQGDYYDPYTYGDLNRPDHPNPRSCPVCLLGAIAVAAGADPENWVETSQSRDAVLAVGRRLGIDLEPGGVPLDLQDNRDIEHMACEVGGWNDTDAREAEDVIAVLEAAAKAEREAGS